MYFKNIKINGLSPLLFVKDYYLNYVNFYKLYCMISCRNYIFYYLLNLFYMNIKINIF